MEQATGRKNFFTVQVMARLAVLGTIAFLLTFLETAPIFSSFLKLDPSDIPAVFATLLYGPIGGVVVQLMKAVMDSFKSSTVGIGQMANFIAGSAYAIPLGLVYRKMPRFAGFWIGGVIGTVCMVVMACLANYVLVPLYGMKITMELVLWTLAPFNLLKATLITVVSGILYVPMLPVLRRARGAHGK